MPQSQSMAQSTALPNGERSLRMQGLRDRLRPGQQRMADWQGGPLAVSAVPGSGKSTGMAIAAAILLGQRYEHRLHQRLNSLSESPADHGAEGQLVLVTFTRSAAANLRAKVRQYLGELGLPANGFMVYTLHGLALSIANRHPHLSGLDLSQMTLVSPNQSNRLLKQSVESWIAAHPQIYQQLLEGQQFDGEETERLRRQSTLRTEMLPNLARTLIHEVKSSGVSPQDLYALSQQPRAVSEQGPSYRGDYNVLAIAAGLYEQYQGALRSRNFMDYDDMIVAALRVLDDPTARSLWQSQIFAVFEDEAQDSSPLQTRLLEVLATQPEQQTLNLVRVGDPNQAINSTFTPADPIFFRDFCRTCQAQDQLAMMDQAGRSSPVIMAAANHLLHWVNQRQPSQDLTQPFQPQDIRPVSPNDPQLDANPAPLGQGLELRRPLDPPQTVQAIARRAQTLIAENPNLRMAILVREHRQGRFVASCLRQPEQYGIDCDLEAAGLPLYDVGERDRQSHVPQEILALLQFIDRPHSPDRLKEALRILSQRQCIPSQDLNAIASFPEQFLYPGPLDPPQAEPVRQARRYCTGVLRARLELPQHQLIPFLAFTLNYNQAELATADKLADRIAQQTSGQPTLSFIVNALSEVVTAENFEPVDTDDADSRYTRPGQLTLITMHKAKGLDWDVVFLPFLQADVIPGQLRVLPQMKFLGEVDWAEVGRAQFRAYLHQEPAIPDTPTAWQRAIALKTAEEYRLLYVAMTRAKRLLWMAAEQQGPFSWSTPTNWESRPACPGFLALCQAFPDHACSL